MATYVTWPPVGGGGGTNNVVMDSNTTETTAITLSGGGIATEAILVGKGSAITVTGAGSAAGAVVFGRNNTLSATTGLVDGVVLVGTGHSCVAGTSSVSGAIAIGTGVTIGTGAIGSITLGHSITNGTANSFLVAPGGNPSLFVPDQQYGNFFFHTNFPATVNAASYTMTPSDLLGGCFRFNLSSAVSVTPPTGADMDAFVAMTQNLWVGMTFLCFIQKLNAGNLVWTDNTGFTGAPQLLTHTAQTGQVYLIRRIGVNTWTHTRTG